MTTTFEYEQSSKQEQLQILRKIRHDFRGPLTTLRMLAQIFQESAEKGSISSEPDITVRNSRMMIDQVDRLVVLADEYSDITLIAMNAFQLNFINCDLRPIVELVAERLGQKIKNLVLPIQLLNLRSDVSKLEQASYFIWRRGECLELELRSDSHKIYLEAKGLLVNQDLPDDPSMFIARKIISDHQGTIVAPMTVEFAISSHS